MTDTVITWPRTSTTDPVETVVARGGFVISSSRRASTIGPRSPSTQMGGAEPKSPSSSTCQSTPPGPGLCRSPQARPTRWRR